jgi:hypothetical protein
LPGLIAHLEQYLGPIEEGYTKDADGVPMPFQITLFGSGPGPGTVSFATVGLNRYGLASPSTGRELHLELLMHVPDALRDGPIPALLHQVAMGMLADGRALVRGQVLGPHGPILPGSAMEGFYVTMPSYYPDEFASTEEDGQAIAIAWLVPISAREAKYVAKRGFDAFEDRLAEHDPDLTDLNRPSLRL